MNEHDNDLVARSTDIIHGLIQDGYPEFDQLKIVSLTFCLLLAEYSKSENHLQKGIEGAIGYINKTVPIYYGYKVAEDDDRTETHSPHR